MKTYSPLRTILNELKNHLEQQHTGTFFIASDTNTSARLGLKEGKIIYCCYQRFHGIEAINALCHLKSGRWSFSNSPFPFHNKSVVEHKESLDKLGVSLKTVKPIEPNKQKQEFDKISISTYIYRGQVIKKEKAEYSKSKTKKKRKTSQKFYRGYPLND